MKEIEQILDQYDCSKEDKERLSAWIEGEGFADQAIAIDALAQLFGENEEYEKALDFLTKALDFAINENGPESLEVAILENNLGRICDQLNDSDTAYQHYTKALEIGLSISGEEDEFTLRVRSNIAMAVMHSGNPEEALSQFMDVYEKRKALHGDHHPHTLRTMNSIGVCHQLLGNYDEAEGWLQKAYSQQKEIVGETHPKTLITLGNLAGLWIEQGKYQKAEILQKEVFALSQKTLGKKHLRSISAGLELANLFGLQKKYEEAQNSYKEIINVLEESFGNDHPKVLHAQYQLALLNMERGEPDEDDFLAYSKYHIHRGNQCLEENDLIGAKYFFEEVIAVSDQIQPEKRTDYFTALRALGDICFQEKDYPKAVEYFEKLEELGRNALGEGSRAHLEFLTLKSYALLKANDKEEAWNGVVFLNNRHEEMMAFKPEVIRRVYQNMLVFFQDYQKMIEHYESFAIDANDLFKEVGEMALELIDVDARDPKNFEKADEMLDKAEKLNEEFGLTQPIVYRVKAKLHYQLEEWDKAIPVLQKGLVYLARWDHEFTLGSLGYYIELGNLYMQLDDVKGALEYFKHAARVIEQNEDIDSSEVIDVYSSLALLHYELSDVEYMAYHENEAKNWIEKAIPLAESRKNEDPEMLENLKNLEYVLTS